MLPTKCPNCICNLRGDKITKDKEWLLLKSTHYTKAIGVYDGDGKLIKWRCPECGIKFEEVNTYVD